MMLGCVARRLLRALLRNDLGASFSAAGSARASLVTVRPVNSFDQAKRKVGNRIIAPAARSLAVGEELDQHIVFPTPQRFFHELAQAGRLQQGEGFDDLF